MSDWQDILRSQSDWLPGANFEERVFSKIRKKKKLKKISYGLTAMVSILMLVSLLQVFRPADRHALQTGITAPAQSKEEIPLHENLFFSASDNRTRYSLEPVSLQKKPQGSRFTVNQI